MGIQMTTGKLAGTSKDGWKRMTLQMRTFVLLELLHAARGAEGDRKAELANAAEALNADINAFLKLQSGDNMMAMVGSWAAGYRLLEGR
jgi:hypothetical protein